MTEQNEIINLLNKRNMEQKKEIRQLKEDILFLKQALAIALKDSTIVYRNDNTEPQFELNENINNEIIIRVK